jgi:hypothetical protein
MRGKTAPEYMKREEAIKLRPSQVTEEDEPMEK